MEHIRALVRLAAFSVVASLTVLFALAIKVLPVSKGTFLKWKNIVVRKFAWASMHIIGLKVTIKGNPPCPPFFLATNHLSYLDILPLWYSVKGTFIAKSEVKSWPFFGFACKTLDVLFIDRKNSRDIPRVNEQISSVFTPEQGIILFPEGTSSYGAEVLPFKAPLLYYPSSEGIPVYHASISYRTDDRTKPAHSHVCWWGNMTFFNHFFNLLKIETITATVVFGDQPVVHSDRKELANKLHQKITEDFTPVVMQDEVHV